MSTFKNMASFFTFLIHHFINLYEIDQKLNLEIVPEICPLVEFSQNFLGKEVIIRLIHTEGNMFRIMISTGAESEDTLVNDVILIDLLLEDIFLKKYFKLGCFNIGFNII